MPVDEKRSDDDTRAETVRADDRAEGELISDALAEPASRPAPPAPPRRQAGGGAFPGMVLGGILAAAAGFGLARVVPGGWPLQDNSALAAQIKVQADTLAAMNAALEAQVKTQADALADVNAQLADLAAHPAGMAPDEIAALKADLEKRLAGLPAAIDPAPLIARATEGIEAVIAALDSRLTQIELRPAGPGGAASASALAAYDRQLQDLRAQIAAQSAQKSDAAARIEAAAAEAEAQVAAAAQEAERLKAEAEATARAATIAAALGRIRAALEAGGPYSGAIDDLTAAGVQVPADVAGFAGSGVPTLTDLQRSFPAVARDALTAALRAQTGTGWGDRIAAFLRTQTGARSLSPREGTDPDAILSRAEGQLANGDIPATLAELGTLPGPAKDILAPWVADAEARQKAIAALTLLSAAAAE
ncbi:MAG: hypothetical protein INF52_04350 [Rhodobacter sp.]|nr:hypothetical protein [Rhodobacter sp.]